MDKKKNLIKKLKIFRNMINSEIPVEKMFLFGSYAIGKARRWSDIDLIIVSPKFRRKKSYQRARRLYDYWDLNYPVDFLCYTPEEFNKLKKQITIVREAVETGIEI